jgi:hypothetical protein
MTVTGFKATGALRFGSPSRREIPNPQAPAVRDQCDGRLFKIG